MPGKQNVTLSLRPEILRKARILAAQRATSISALLAEQIESLVGAEEAWESAERAALSFLDQGFHLGGQIPARREELHER
jgi:hypothetical protein